MMHLSGLTSLLSRESITEIVLVLKLASFHIFSMFFHRKVTVMCDSWCWIIREGKSPDD
jgi:hypothetical protein